MAVTGVFKGHRVVFSPGGTLCRIPIPRATGSQHGSKPPPVCRRPMSKATCPTVALLRIHRMGPCI